MAVTGRKRKTTKIRRSSQGNNELGGHAQRLSQGRKGFSSFDRVQATNVGSVLHDESDVISFRHSLKNVYLLTSRLMDLLLTQPIPVDKIKSPELFPKGALELVTDHLERQKGVVTELRTSLRELQGPKDESTGEAGKVEFYRRGIDTLADKLYDRKVVAEVEREYSHRFNFKVRPNSVIIHRNKFTHLVPERTQAPPDYWKRHRRILAEKRDHERKAKEQEEERKRQEQMALSVDPLPVDLGVPAKTDEVGQQQIPVVDPNDPDLLDNVFADEPFQNAFDDDFGDLDTAFF